MDLTLHLSPSAASEPGTGHRLRFLSMILCTWSVRIARFDPLCDNQNFQISLRRKSGEDLGVISMFWSSSIYTAYANPAIKLGTSSIQRHSTIAGVIGTEGHCTQDNLRSYFYLHI